MKWRLNWLGLRQSGSFARRCFLADFNTDFNNSLFFSPILTHLITFHHNFTKFVEMSYINQHLVGFAHIADMS